MIHQYKNNGYNGTDLTHLIELEFDFRRVFNITYSGFSGNTSGLPSQMIDGDTKTITFNATSGIPTNVVVTGASGSYSSPTLTLSNVTISLNSYSFNKLNLLSNTFLYFSNVCNA